MEETRQELLRKLSAAEKVISAQEAVIAASDSLIALLESQVKALEQKSNLLLAELIAAETELELAQKRDKPSLN